MKFKIKEKDKLKIKITPPDELNIILQNYKSYSDRVNLLIKISYEIGFGTITSAALIMTYSILKADRTLIFFCAVPFVLFIGGIIYCHVMKELLMYFGHMMKIEKNINMNNARAKKKKKKINILDIVSNFGFHSGEYTKNIRQTAATMAFSFSLGYIFSCLFGLLFLYLFQIASAPTFSQIPLFFSVIFKKFLNADIYTIIFFALAIIYICFFVILLYLIRSFCAYYKEQMEYFEIERPRSLILRIILIGYGKNKTKEEL